MSVSGRKISGFRRSVLTRTAEDFVHSCVPCLSEDQHVEAHGFCVDCQEYLCTNCLHCHKKTKASKHHHLLDIDEVDEHAKIGQTSNVCTEKCPTHRNEVIKFFCPTHAELGCTDCMTMQHKACDLVYIPDKCAGIADCEEYKATMKELDQKLREADTVMKKAADRINEIDTWYDEVSRDVIKFRKKINEHLDVLQEKIEIETAKRKSLDKQEVTAILESCATLTSNMKKLQTSLIDIKAANQNGDIFIAIKRARSRLQSDKLKQTETTLDEKTNLLFECNKGLEKILSIDELGELTENLSSLATVSSKLKRPINITRIEVKQEKPHPKTQATYTANPLHATEKKLTPRSFTHKTDLDIKTETDIRPCNITGCAAISCNRLVLTDFNNGKLKIVNTLTNTVDDEAITPAKPFDVTVLPEDQIAVTTPGMGMIWILGTAGQLSISHSVSVQGRCRGITYHKDHLYVACAYPNCVLILDKKGNVRDKIFFEDKTILNSPHCIALSKDGQLLYISEYTTNTIVSVTFQGKVSAVNNDTSEPMGLVMLDDDSSLVCCRNINSIYRLQSDLKQGFELRTGLNKPQSICCSAEKSEFYVGGKDCNELKVFILT